MKGMVTAFNENLHFRDFVKSAIAIAHLPITDLEDGQLAMYIKKQIKLSEIDVMQILGFQNQNKEKHIKLWLKGGKI